MTGEVPSHTQLALLLSKTVSWAADAPPPVVGGSSGGGSSAARAPLLPATKSKGTFALRKWLAVSPEGELRHLELAKLRVTHFLGVQLRDLR